MIKQGNGIINKLRSQYRLLSAFYQILIQIQIPVSMSYSKHFICLQFSLLLTFMLFLQSASAQYNFGEVDQLIEQRKALFGGNLVALAWQNDKIIYQKAIGDLTINSQESMAAASNWFTAALVMTFVDQGKLSLDAPVARYLPIFAQYAKSYLTIRHCLSNTTGLEGTKTGLPGILKKNKFASLEEEVNAYASKREIVNNPGLEFTYNNIGSNIAGRVLEIVGKKSFDRLMLERIFRPLGMKKSSFTSETAVDPAGGARSTPSDYLRFLAMLLNKGSLNGKRILSEEAVAEMQKIQTNGAKTIFVPKAANGFSYGLGEWIQESDDKGNSTIVSSPGLSGTWPYIDKCRNYACIIFEKNQGKESKRDPYLEIKEAIESVLPNGCK